MPEWESLHSGIKKTHFFASLTHDSSKFCLFFFCEFKDTWGNVQRWCYCGNIVGCGCSVGRWGRCCFGGPNAGFLFGAHSSNMALFEAFKAAPFLSMLLLFGVGCGFLCCSTCIHGIRISWGKLGSRWTCTSFLGIIIVAAPEKLPTWVIIHLVCLLLF